jgi:hypothetical protein
MANKRIPELDPVVTAAQTDKFIVRQSGDVEDKHVDMSVMQLALQITESQITDLQAYLTAEVNDLTAAVTWDDIPDANVPASAVTQHVGSIDHDQLLNFAAGEHFTQAAISITESQVSDLQAYLLDITGEPVGDLSDVFNSTPVDRHVLVYDGITDNRYENRLLVEADISDLQSYLTAEVNDLSAAVTWANIPDANVPETAVTQHEAAIDHDQLTNFLASEHFTQAAISITESQISDLQSYGFGDVTKVGTPSNDQVGVWTGDGTIEGTAGLKFGAAGLQVDHDILIGNSAISGVYFAKAATPVLANVSATSVVPSVRPNKSDSNSGLGLHSFDAPSMIAGGVEAQRWAELNGGVIQVPKGNTAITAFSGGGQGSATQLNDSYNVLTVVAAPGDSVKLPPVFGLYSIVSVKNDGANAADIFPASGHNLGAGVDTAVSIAAGSSRSFIATSEWTVGSPTWTPWDVDTGLVAEVNDLSAAVTWANIPDANVPESAVTQHEAAIDHDALANFSASEHFTQAAISITESQISDLGTYLDATDIVSQAEAEAGTATTARAWTAQRVSQAIAALESASTAFAEYFYYATDFLNPNNADWDISVLAPAVADSNNAALTVRLYDDTTEEAVGMFFRLPTGATNIVLDFVSRAETAPGGAVAAKPAIEFRTIDDNGAVQSPPWTTLTLNDIDLPANENFQHDSQSITLVSLGLTAGEYVQMELKRVPTHPNDDLVGDWALLSCRVSFT